MTQKMLICLLLVALFCPGIPGGGAEAEFDERLEHSFAPLFFGRRAGEWRLYRDSGEPLLPPEYAWSDADFCLRGNGRPGEGPYPLEDLPFSGGIGRIRFGRAETERYGYIDLEGRFVVAPVYLWLSPSFTGELAEAEREDGQRGLIDRTGRWLLDLAPGERLAWDDSDDTYRLSDPDAGEAAPARFYRLADGRLEELTSVGTEIDLTPYRAHSGELTPRLDAPAALALDDPLPRVDGAKAVFPFYSGVVEAVYPAEVEYADAAAADPQPVYTFTNTPDAYRRLIVGEADVIFVAQPSDRQLADAAAAGVEFELTPIMKEAFVFFVSADNPLDGLTVAEIQGIYSGAIADWADLGAPELGHIVAYQRNEGSGSQTALERLMGDVPLMEPPATWDMGGFMEAIVTNTEFKSLPNAIGFSFRFFVTGMMESRVKLLALDGVAPTEANIANGSYPVVAEVYAVTRRGEENPNVRRLLDWLLSSEGQELARRSGYVPVR